MNKRQRQEFDDRKRLQDAGWKVRQRDAVAFNSGSENPTHYLCKALVAQVLKARGFRIDTEVAKESAGEIDVVAYGKDDAPTVIEVETDPTEAVIQDKLTRYYEDEPFREVFVIDPTEMPESLFEARNWVSEQL